MGMKLDDIMAFEDGQLSDYEVALMVCDGLNDDSIWRFQGSYGRLAKNLLDAKIVHKVDDRYCVNDEVFNEVDNYA